MRASTLESSARPGATEASQRATASRPLSGSTMSATETTNATSGTSEKSSRYDTAAASWEVAWRLYPPKAPNTARPNGWFPSRAPDPTAHSRTTPRQALTACAHPAILRSVVTRDGGRAEWSRSARFAEGLSWFYASHWRRGVDPTRASRLRSRLTWKRRSMTPRRRATRVIWPSAVA